MVTFVFSYQFHFLRYKRATLCVSLCATIQHLSILSTPYLGYYLPLIFTYDVAKPLHPFDAYLCILRLTTTTAPQEVQRHFTITR